MGTNVNSSVLVPVVQSINPHMSDGEIMAWATLLGIIVRWLHLEAKTIYAAVAWVWSKFYAACQFTVSKGGFWPMWFTFWGAHNPSEKMATIAAPVFTVIAVIVVVWTSFHL